MKKFLAIVGFLFVSGSYANAATSIPISVPYSTLVTSASATAGGSITLVVSSPTASVGPYSSGYFNYITSIHIEMYAAGTLTGGATPVTCTTTNLPGSPVFKFQTAEATGTEQVLDMQFANPVQATQASQVTVVCPNTTSVVWNVIVGYFASN